MDTTNVEYNGAWYTYKDHIPADYVSKIIPKAEPPIGRGELAIASSGPPQQHFYFNVNLMHPQRDIQERSASTSNLPQANDSQLSVTYRECQTKSASTSNLPQANDSQLSVTYGKSQIESASTYSRHQAQSSKLYLSDAEPEIEDVNKQENSHEAAIHHQDKELEECKEGIKSSQEQQDADVMPLIEQTTTLTTETKTEGYVKRFFGNLMAIINIVCKKLKGQKSAKELEIQRERERDRERERTERVLQLAHMILNAPTEICDSDLKNDLMTKLIRTEQGSIIIHLGIISPEIIMKMTLDELQQKIAIIFSKHFITEEMCNGLEDHELIITARIIEITFDKASIMAEEQPLEKEVTWLQQLHKMKHGEEEARASEPQHSDSDFITYHVSGRAFTSSAESKESKQQNSVKLELALKKKKVPTATLR